METTINHRGLCRGYIPGTFEVMILAGILGLCRSSIGVI